MNKKSTRAMRGLGGVSRRYPFAGPHGAGSLKLALLFAGLQAAVPAARADTFTVRSGVCPDGACVGTTADAPCNDYASGRVAFSQNNPNDHNKWTKYDSLVTSTPGKPTLAGCLAGSCSFVLEAESHFRQPTSTSMEVCLTVSDDDKTQDKDGPCHGNPIFPLEGRKRQPVTIDVGISDLQTVLTYDNGARLPTGSEVVVPSSSAVRASFGPLWLSSWHKKLLVGPASKSARVSRGDGHVVSFVGDGSGVFVADRDIDDRLVRSPDQFRYFDLQRAQIETYTLDGVLSRISAADGREFVLTYSDSKTSADIAPGPLALIKVADRFGREIGFRYFNSGSGNGLVSQVIDPVGATIGVTYVNGNLQTLTWQDLKKKTFLYERPDLDWALTGVVTEEAQRLSTFEYDSAGRATATEHALGTQRYSVSYTTAPLITVADQYNASDDLVYRSRRWQAPMTPIISTPEGAAVKLEVGLVSNHAVVNKRNQPGGAGCNASSSELGYDSRGNVQSKLDFGEAGANRRRSCYAYDVNRNVETYRIEGMRETSACPADLAGYQIPNDLDPQYPQRKIASEWHPLWKLETRRAEPKRIITTIYNGEKDPPITGGVVSCVDTDRKLPDGSPIAVVCRRYEQATSDQTGNLGFAAPVTETRKWSYTYNQYGQLQTETDPRNKTTSYEYWPATSFSGEGNAARGHWWGDLMTVTRPLGQKTQSLEYNKRGQPLTIQHPNNSVEMREYHVRGWLMKVTRRPAGALDALKDQVTKYDYYATGLLKTVTEPDNSVVTYTYDEAERLKEVKDSLGNKVTYTLDNAGNRTHEEFTDSADVLAKTISRTFDALGRLSKATGMQ
jgi:YD repeat-containing protein